MDARTVLYGSIIAQWVLLILSAVLLDYFRSSVPPELHDFLTNSDPEIPLIIEGNPVLIVHFIASVGLMYVKDWARWVFLCSFVVTLTIPLGPIVQHPIESLIQSLVITSNGLIIGISFFGGVIPKRPDSVASRSS